MMDVRTVILLVIAGLASSGCFSSTTVVRVRADGSGTIEVTSALRKAALLQLSAIGGDAADDKSLKLEAWFPERQARAAASSLGPDVRFVSSRPIDSDDALGLVALYEFPDLRHVTLEPIPIFPAEGAYGASAKLDGEHRFTFDLLDEAEDGRLIVVRMPDARIEHDGLNVYAGGVENTDPEQLAQFRTFVAGGRLEVVLELEQPIVRTNTPHRNGRRVTLVRLDAEPLLFDSATGKRLLLQPGSLDELRYRLHDAPGVTVSLEREIRIEVSTLREGSRVQKTGPADPGPERLPVRRKLSGGP